MNFDIPPNLITIWKDASQVQKSKDYRISTLAKMTVNAIEASEHEKALMYWGHCERHMLELLAKIEAAGG